MENKPIKWEYFSFDAQPNLWKAWCIDYGEEGWELVQVVFERDTVLLIFKRPKV